MTTKILAMVDALGNLIDFKLMPGQRNDICGVSPLIEGKVFEALLADKAFDADWLLLELEERGSMAVIPPRSNRKEQRSYDKEIDFFPNREIQVIIHNIDLSGNEIRRTQNAAT